MSEDGGTRRETTDAAGRFRFAEVRSGRSRVSAEDAGRRSPTMTVDRSSDAGQDLRLVVQPAAGAPAQVAAAGDGTAMEFSDKPNFAVAGVTDWTAVGGHGSDATLRASEDLARATMGLKADGATPVSVGKGDGAKLLAAVSAAPLDSNANRELGEFYLRSGRYAEAVPVLARASALDGATARIEYDLGLACQGVGDVVAARRHVGLALRREDAAEFHRLAGELDEAAGDPLAAVREEERATRMEPSEENYFVWGSELLLHRAIWQAAEVFAVGAKAHPASARLQTAWGAALFAGARYAEAAERLCAAADREPASAEPYVFLGRIALAAPEVLPCVQPRLQRFVQVAPSRADAQYFYAMSLLKQGAGSDGDGARRALLRAVELDPKYAEALLELGVLAFQGRNYPEAIAFYRRAAEADPQQAEAHYRLGVVYDRTGDAAEARQEFARHDELVSKQAETVEQQRRQVKQFLVVLAGQRGGSETP